MAHLATPLVFPLGGGLNVATSVDVCAQDLLSVTFAEPMKNDVFLQASQAYRVVSVDGGQDVSVDEVQTGNSIDPTTVYLIVTPPTIGKRYKVFFQNLYGITGSVLSPLGCEFLARTTKQDSIIGSRPQMFDMTPDSLLRKVYQAFGRQDDLIGGARGDRYTPFQYLTDVPIVVDFSPKSAAGGTPVLVYGTNFTGATALKFNGVASPSFTVVDDGTISAIVPNAAGTGPVSVTTPVATGTSSGSFVGT